MNPELNPGLSGPKVYDPSVIPHGQGWTIPLSYAEHPASPNPQLVPGALLPTDWLLMGVQVTNELLLLGSVSLLGHPVSLS